MATLTKWFVLRQQSSAITPTTIPLRTLVSKLESLGRRCVSSSILMPKTDGGIQRDARSRFAKLPGGRAAPVVVPSYVGGKTVPDPKPDYDDDGDEDDDWGTI